MPYQCAPAGRADLRVMMLDAARAGQLACGWNYDQG
jgi:hypothetical protein